MNVESRFEELFSGYVRAQLESRLAEYIAARRWFRSKTRVVASASLEHVVPLPIASLEVALTVVRVRYTEGPAEDYVLPITWVDGNAGEHLARTRPHLLLGTVSVASESCVRWIVDALGVPRALEGLLALIARSEAVRADGCTLAFRWLVPVISPKGVTPRAVDVEQSNTSVIYGDACILKIVRKLDDGTAPDLEMGEFLTRAGYSHSPRLMAAVELARSAGDPATLGLLHEFVPNQGDAWSFTLAAIRRSLESPGAVADRQALEQSIWFVRPLARRIAEMHTVLASQTSDSRFSPEPIEREEREKLGMAAARSLDAAWTFVDEHASTLLPDVVERVRALRAREADYRGCIERFLDSDERFMKTRVHGDLHLGQVLVSGEDFVLIDFEGEPGRRLAERKAKRSPLADVAGVLRSLHYASVSALRAAPRPDGMARVFTETWHRTARLEFLRAYFDASAAKSVLPEDGGARAVLLRFYLLEKCVYELHYEINNRPDWVGIPVLGLEQILEGDDAA